MASMVQPASLSEPRAPGRAGTSSKSVDLHSSSSMQLSAPSAEHMHQCDDGPNADDAPMTPVVYLVLWTSIAVGVLRGYIQADVIAARVAPSYTRTFSGGETQAAILARTSPFCATGVDGLPGQSWYESVIELLPLLVPLFGAGFLKKWGRKMGIMLGCSLAIIGQVLLASAVHVVMLYVGGATARAASDIVFLSSGLQIVEIAPRTSRGVFLMAHMLGVAVGTVLAAVLGYFVSDQGPLGWRLLFGVALLPAAAVMVVVPWLYETPNSLIQRGKYAEGWAALREVRGPFYDPYPEYQAIVAASAAMPHSINMYVQLLTNPIHRPAILTCAIMAVTSSLLNPLTMTYVAYTAFRFGGYSLNLAVFLSNICTAGAYALGIVVASLLVDRAGRLILLRISSALAIATVVVLLAVTSMHATAEQKGTAALLKWAWLQLAVLSVLSAVNGIAWSSAAWVIIMESQALTIRPAGVALCITCSGMGMALIEAKLLCQLNWYYYIVILALSVISLFLSLFCVPETARVPLESITQLWLNHRLWSRVVHKQAALQRGGCHCDDSNGSQAADAVKAAATAAVRAAETRRHASPAGRWQRHHLDASSSGLEQLAAELHSHPEHGAGSRAV